MRPVRPRFLLPLALLSAVVVADAHAQCAGPDDSTAGVSLPQTSSMRSLPLLNEPAPDFDAMTTDGRRRLSDYHGRWLVLFSHPADFTPVCTTEFIGFAKAYDRFAALNTDLLGLSIDSRYAHIAWVRTIREKFGVEIPFPIIEDLSMTVASAYGMIHPGASNTAAVRATFLIDPEGVMRAMIYYPMTNGRSVEEILRLLEALQTSDQHKVATPEGWRPGDAVIVPPPATASDAAKRMLEGFDCKDWFFCTKKLGDATTAVAPAEHRAIVTDKLEPYECGTVKRLHTVQGIFLASQPQPADFEQAKKGGIKTVINQRHESENKEFDERAVVTGLGMTYFNPAFNGAEELTDHVLDRTRELLRTAERPLLIHCSSANRTGAVWFAYRVLDDGRSIDDALAEAKEVGLRSDDYERIVRDYITRRSAESMPASSSMIDIATRDALVEALADERRARAFYKSVIAVHGELRPFSHVVLAEERHEALLLGLFAKYGVPVPTDEFASASFDVPHTFRDACAAAATAERENAQLYDRLIQLANADDVRTTFKQLRAMSLEHHLPAFERGA